MPKWLEDIVRLIYRLPTSKPEDKTWKRLRIAISREELKEYKAWHQSGKGEFPWAIRGFPITIEDYPLHPGIIVEYRE